MSESCPQRQTALPPCACGDVAAMAILLCVSYELADSSHSGLTSANGRTDGSAESLLVFCLHDDLVSMSCLYDLDGRNI